MHCLLRGVVVMVDDNRFRQISRKTWYRWSFYINIILFFIVAISVLFLILDSYAAGKIAIYGGGDALSQTWLYIARDIGFLSISLGLEVMIIYDRRVICTS